MPHTTQKSRAVLPLESIVHLIYVMSPDNNKSFITNRRAEVWETHQKSLRTTLPQYSHPWNALLVCFGSRDIHKHDISRRISCS